jgi:hypothetical protein
VEQPVAEQSIKNDVFPHDNRLILKLVFLDVGYLSTSTRMPQDLPSGSEM